MEGREERIHKFSSKVLNHYFFPIFSPAWGENKISQNGESRKKTLKTRLVEEFEYF